MCQKNVDMVVIGAGLYGIAASRTYLDVHPDCQLVILEQDTCPGGVWNAKRSYDGFWSQTGLRAAQFSDMPLTLPPKEETYHDLFEAKHITKYLEEYVDNHMYSGSSLHDRIIYGYTVQRIEKFDGKWAINGKHAGAKTCTFYTPKLMIATGLSSTPNTPTLSNQSKFKGLVLHHKSFGSSPTFSSSSIRNVSVLGGSKSAADMVYASAKAGKSVSWIIRDSGHGPGVFANADGRGPYKNAPELASTRLASAFSPSCFNQETWWASHLHRTSYGRLLINLIYASADKRVREVANYRGRTGAGKGFDKLESYTKIFWCNGGSIGLIPRPDFWETIADKVQVYRSDIIGLDEDSILLSNGTKVPSDVLLCGTGWTDSHGIFLKDQLVQLGLPHDIFEDTTEDDTQWVKLQETADRRVLELFPGLTRPPTYHEKPAATTPYRLYNCIAPLYDDSIAFLGHVHIPNNFQGAEVQAIWATAYLDKQLQLPNLRDMQADIAFVNAWCARRYPTHGQQGNFFHFDVVGYTDKLLREIGLSSHRKGRWSDLTAPFLASDLKGIREEYLRMIAASR